MQVDSKPFKIVLEHLALWRNENKEEIPVVGKKKFYQIGGFPFREAWLGSWILVFTYDKLPAFWLRTEKKKMAINKFDLMNAQLHLGGSLQADYINEALYWSSLGLEKSARLLLWSVEFVSRLNEGRKFEWRLVRIFWVLAKVGRTSVALTRGRRWMRTCVIIPVSRLEWRAWQDDATTKVPGLKNLRTGLKICLADCPCGSKSPFKILGHRKLAGQNFNPCLGVFHAGNL